MITFTCLIILLIMAVIVGSLYLLMEFGISLIVIADLVICCLIVYRLVKWIVVRHKDE